MVNIVRMCRDSLVLNQVGHGAYAEVRFKIVGVFLFFIRILRIFPPLLIISTIKFPRVRMFRVLPMRYCINPRSSSRVDNDTRKLINIWVLTLINKQHGLFTDSFMC
ncbi:MAG TPA: hypothetical protein DCZ93_12690 [Elusimicrobia bacterium]|nr:hypothetical protein [Elusimicrobiota bacterium]